MIDVKKYGAAGDGKTYDTDALQKAIDDGAQCGEPVRIPAGTYLTGTLFLKSGTTLRLDMGAVILGSPDIGRYADDTHFNRYAGEAVMDKCLFYAEDAEGIRISGGTLDGNGAHFYGEAERETIHPMMFRFLRCRDIVMTDFCIRNPAAWSTAFLECEDIRITGADIVSRHFNGDGLDFDSCRNVFVNACRFDTSDDCFCIQNSVRGRASRNIIVSGCVMKSRWAAVRIGLLSSGDIEDVVISDCIFYDCGCSGFKIQAAEEGRIRNILMSNIIMRNVVRPIFVTSNYSVMGVFYDGKYKNPEGIDGLFFENIRIECSEETDDAVSGILVVGIPERRVRNIRMDRISYRAGAEQEKVCGTAESLEDKRPESYSLEQSPAAALFARHVDDLSVSGSELASAGEKEPMVFEDCSKVRVTDSRINGKEFAAGNTCSGNFRLSFSP